MSCNKRIWNFVYTMGGFFLIAIPIFLLTKLVLTPWDKACQHEIFNLQNAIESPSEIEFWVDYTGVILSFASILFILATIIMQLYQLRLQKNELNKNFEITKASYDSYVLKLIDKYLGKDMGDCRQTCWLLREEMKRDPNAIKEIQNIFKMQIKDSWGTRTDYEKLQETSRFKDYAQFTKLVRYFDMLSHYKISAETAYAIHFYYVWWRSFFIEMIECFKNAADEIPEQEQHLHFLPDWCYLVNRLDKQMEKYKLPLA